MNENILVAGCGGDIGQSILKILREHYPNKRLIGCDIHDKHPGIFLCDEFYLVDRVSSTEYVDQLRNIITKNKIGVLIPTSEPELRHHTQYDTFNILNDDLGVRVILANHTSREIGFDKFATSTFLETQGLPFLDTQLMDTTVNPIFPCILKDRKGSGSKLLKIIKNRREWEYYSSNYSNLIYQEYISEEEGEYTCGVFRFERKIRTIIFKRLLQGGYSSYGEVIEHKQIHDLLSKLAIDIDLQGSINVQLRLRSDVPYIFEINPRFSSTVLFRHLLGFQDLIWSIESSLRSTISAYKAPETGSKFYKGFQEYLRVT